MPVGSTTALVNGNAMDWSVVSANSDVWRTFFNGGAIIGDFAAAGLERENIYRAEVLPFPAAALIAPTQRAFRYAKRIEGPNHGNEAEYRGRREKFIIKPSVLSHGDNVRTDIGRRITLVETSKVNVEVQLGYFCSVYDSSTWYPNGSGGGDRGGYFVITTYAVGTDTEQFRTESIAYCYPKLSASGNGRFREGLALSFTGSLGAGEHDVYVTYRKGESVTEILQIDIDRSNLKVEVFPDV